MRTKSTRQAYLDMFLPSSTTKVVAQYCEKYSAIGTILLDNPALLDLAHADFVRWLSDSDDGRESRYTSEELLRTLVVMFLEQDSYRDVVVRIETSEFLRSFIGLGFCKPMMDFTLVSKAFSAMSGETWKAMNDALGQYARAGEKITGERMRPRRYTKPTSTIRRIRRCCGTVIGCWPGSCRSFSGNAASWASTTATTPRR